MKFLNIAIPALATLAQAAHALPNRPAARSPTQASGAPDLLEAAKKLGLTGFIKAFQKTRPEFRQTLSAGKTFIIPDNYALNIDEKASPAQIEDILKWHIIDSLVVFGDFKTRNDEVRKKTLAGNYITIVAVGQYLDVNVISETKESARVKPGQQDVLIKQGRLSVINSQIYVPGKSTASRTGKDGPSADQPVG